LEYGGEKTKKGSQEVAAGVSSRTAWEYIKRVYKKGKWGFDEKQRTRLREENSFAQDKGIGKKCRKGKGRSQLEERTWVVRGKPAATANKNKQNPEKERGRMGGRDKGELVSPQGGVGGKRAGPKRGVSNIAMFW